MKQLFYIFFLFNFLSSFCQIDSKTTNYDTCAYLFHFIDNDSLEFIYTQNGGLSMKIYGYGKIERKHKKIILRTVRPKSVLFSHYNILDSINSKNIVIKDIDDGYPIPYCNAILVNNANGKFIQGTISDKMGKISFDDLEFLNSEKVDLILSLVGYDSYSIPLKEIQGRSISIVLSPFTILDNKIIKFKIIHIDGEESYKGPYLHKKIGWIKFE